MKHGDPRVLRAHPTLIVGLVEPSRPWRADVVGETTRRAASDVEVLGALPVDEQAALLCSILACDRAGPHILDYGDDPVSDDASAFAAETMMGAPLVGGVSSLFECWAEAEARIRNGEVSP